MAPTQEQIEHIKTLCMRFTRKGYAVYFGIAPEENGSYAVVRLKGGGKEWNFCDPSWEVVQKQLETLTQNTLDLIN